MKNMIHVVVLLVLLGGLPGCKLGPQKKTTTDWSLPSVKLPTAKRGDSIPKPSERANPEGTSELAHDRQAGHNPAAASDGEDPTLRPNPSEMAELSRFEGGDVPSWATGADVPAETAPAETAVAEKAVAETDTTIPALDTSASPSSVAPTVGALAEGELPASLDNGLPPIDPAAANAVASDMPAALPTEAATYPQTGNQLHLGASVSELPGSVTPAAATVPASTPAAQPAVLFAPGNINPAYPSSAPSQGTLDATSTAPLLR